VKTGKIEPMVTIHGWYVNRKKNAGIPVFNPKEVSTYFDAKRQPVISESMIRKVCYQLEQKCRDVDPWDWH
jgi:hypothetical protein